MLRLSFGAESFPIAGTFTISRGSKTAADVVAVQLERNGFKGQGEGVPYPRYNETVPQCLAALEAASAKIETGITRESLPALNLPKAVLNALDCALWDLEAKTQQVPAWKLAGLSGLKPQVTAFTISLDTPEAMAAAALKAAHYPLLKLKLGRNGDSERLAAIRAAVPSARLIVDANEGWDESTLADMLAHCAKADVELVEQPLPQGKDDALKHIKRSTLICADESAHDAASLAELKGKYDAVNIKLDKTGGLTGALEMAKAARAQDFKIMVGCMLATSLAMAPAFLVAQLADYVDLDGPLWMKKDREPAISYAKGVMQAPVTALWG
ncbi:N-acetyl-D-Glu racemase DgcA [Aestuariivirga litoralis]|uniref:N-acetyl-D-Glu racemase DgcA n=1 Tax=Aestuariivirga litoralis TaxID=2650924 RepID=UPI0018C6F240|nr:N-acetyl-D-Glu racemase DgcA [Aestuariivirga litoralis]MBG1233025.1 dipeptide epimerase [Aestuariivirga litoralis]